MAAPLRRQVVGYSRGAKSGAERRLKQSHLEGRRIGRILNHLRLVQLAKADLDLLLNFY